MHQKNAKKRVFPRGHPLRLYVIYCTLSVTEIHCNFKASLFQTSIESHRNNIGPEIFQDASK